MCGVIAPFEGMPGADMRLADFIESDMQAILTKWETFAAALPAAIGMTPLALRNHSRSKS
jgi:hypothetical protein